MGSPADEKKGMFCWSDGRRYVGEYLNDKKDGYGELFWPDGRIYKGMWRNGKQEGKGTLISSKGERKMGIWKNGQIERWISNEEFQEFKSDQ